MTIQPNEASDSPRSVRARRLLTISVASLVLGAAACDDKFLVGIDHAPAPIGGGSGGIAGTGGAGAGAPQMKTVAAVAVGWYHACALMTDGSMRCWGSNYGGQLGDGTTVDHAVPAPVLGISGAVRIDADYTDTCAMFSDGRVSCWGSNNYAQLGDGTTTARSLPVAAIGRPVKQISLGEYHSCAVENDGTASCWGLNDFGRLGDGTMTTRSAPTPVEGLSQVTQISAGAALTCALLATGTVSCWGNNSGSDVCSGPNIQHSDPTPVAGVSGAVQISAGSTHACALLADGTVMCWGDDSVGQLGRAATCVNGFAASPPGGVPGLTGVVEISAGDEHTCARLQDGTVACWGSNRVGQLGDGTTADRAAPAIVPGLAGATQISAGFSGTCAVLGDHSLSCWGEIVEPYTTTPTHLTPAPVVF